jgi:hypothetical protein
MFAAAASGAQCVGSGRPPGPDWTRNPANTCRSSYEHPFHSRFAVHAHTNSGVAVCVASVPPSHWSCHGTGICSQMLLTSDPKKYCGDDVIQPQLVLACGNILKRCGSSKFDFSSTPEAVDAVAAMTIDVSPLRFARYSIVTPPLCWPCGVTFRCWSS